MANVTTGRETLGEPSEYVADLMLDRVRDSPTGEAVRAPSERIPCGRPIPNEQLGDPIINLSTMGRAWARWDAGELSRRDDRVLAPYADVWSLGDQFLLFLVLALLILGHAVI